MISRQNKVIVLFNPKTGTKTLHSLFMYKVPDVDFHSLAPTNKGHYHFPLSVIADRDEGIKHNIQNYRIVSFYRDPIDRFLSGMAWHRMKYPDIVTPEMTIKEYIEYPMAFVHQLPYICDRETHRSRRYFDGMDLNWTLLNYHDFENEVIRLGNMFGLNLDKSEIPKENVSENRQQIENLTQEEIAMIKNVYVRDYEYLESQGIMVPSR
jgi:hypothetical protein